MWVECDASECEHKRGKYCSLHYVTMVDGRCSNYKDYCKSDPLYQHEYFKRCRANQDGKTIEYRVQARGMRYEWKEFVLYTGDDIRDGIDSADFTEEITGMLVLGRDMQSREGLEELIRKHIKTQKPVLEYPWMDYDRERKRYVPHEP